MPVPTVLSGVKQSHAATSLEIVGCDVRTLGIVTHRARVTQIAGCGLATQGSWYDVIDCKRFGAQLLLQLTIFAAELRALSNHLSQMPRDICRWSHRPGPCSL